MNEEQEPSTVVPNTTGAYMLSAFSHGGVVSFTRTLIVAWRVNGDHAAPICHFKPKESNHIESVIVSDGVVIEATGCISYDSVESFRKNVG